MSTVPWNGMKAKYEKLQTVTRPLIKALRKSIHLYLYLLYEVGLPT